MSAPLFSVVVPTYDVAAYLPYFLGCLERQTYPVTELDLVFVIDGSPDDSAALVRAWASRVAPQTRVVEQDNAGLSAARNRGLGEARGTWVTFCDPDDGMDPDYFATVAAYLADQEGRQPEVDLVAAYILLLDDATGELVDRHPLRRRFKREPQLVDLVREPDRLHLQAASGFYRRSRVAELGLAFDPRVRPNFEDGAFTARYLWARRRPHLALLPGARYHYRKRADGSSLVQRSWTRPEKLTDLPRHGYLALLTDLRDEAGRVPPWVQNVVLYELTSFLREDDRPYALTGSVAPDVLAEFRALLTEVVDRLDPWAVAAFRVVPTTFSARLALELGRTGSVPPPQVWASRIDPDQQTVELRYFYRGEPPAETLVSRGRPVLPVWGKHRRVDYFGAPAYGERVAWVSATGTIAVELDGVRLPLRTGPPAPEPYRLGPTALWGDLAGTEPPANASTRVARSTAAPAPAPDEPGPSRASRVAALTGRWRRGRGTTPAAEPRPVWLLDDGGEAGHLAAHLRRQHPEVEALVVRRDQPAGPGEVGHGSAGHGDALDRAVVLVSSGPDRGGLVTPESASDAPWVVLGADLSPYDASRLLDRTGLRLLVTGNRAAQRALVADGTRSALTGREVLLTGLPRQDALLAAGPGTVRRLLVAPAARRAEPGRSPAHVEAWAALLADPRLTDLLAARGLTLTLVGDDAAADAFAARLGDAVEVHRTGSRDVALLAEAAVLLTDHGPAAFDVALLRRPVLYFRPPGDDYLSGRHGVRPSGWDDARDGFGPVSSTAAQALARLDVLTDGPPVLAEPYAARAAAELADADGGACERIVAAVGRLRVPLSHGQAYRPVP